MIIYYFIYNTGIKYATAERWKAPVLTTHYGTDIVDATEMGPGCVRND